MSKTEKLNILVVNDDGIASPGFRALVDALSKSASVYVCAPDGQRSAKSHSITLGQPVYVEEVEYPNAIKAYKTSGSPADCTKIGLQFFEDAGIHIDMVYSGINMGSNLGSDTLYSGTVGAAAEAALCGVHGVAVSVDSHEATHFDTAGELAVRTIDMIYGKMDTSVVININVPNLPKEEIRGLRYAQLGGRYYIDKFQPAENGDAGGFALKGGPADFSGLADNVDMKCMSENYAVITPLQFDFTDRKTLEEIKGWEIDL